MGLQFFWDAGANPSRLTITYFCACQRIHVGPIPARHRDTAIDETQRPNVPFRLFALDVDRLFLRG